jgi:hypothetical protein
MYQTYYSGPVQWPSTNSPGNPPSEPSTEAPGTEFSEYYSSEIIPESGDSNNGDSGDINANSIREHLPEACEAVCGCNDPNVTLIFDPNSEYVSTSNSSANIEAIKSNLPNICSTSCGCYDAQTSVLASSTNSSKNPASSDFECPDFYSDDAIVVCSWYDENVHGQKGPLEKVPKIIACCKPYYDNALELIPFIPLIKKL